MGITLQQAGILTVNQRGQNESAIIMFMVVFTEVLTDIG